MSVIILLPAIIRHPETHLVSTISFLAIELKLKTGVTGANYVLAVAPDTDTGSGAALKALATTATATTAGATPASIFAVTATGRNVRATRLYGSRGRGGEASGRRAVAVASGGRSWCSAVECLGRRRLSGLTRAKVGGNVSGASWVEGGAGCMVSCNALFGLVLECMGVRITCAR